MSRFGNSKSGSVCSCWVAQRQSVCVPLRACYCVWYWFKYVLFWCGTVCCADSASQGEKWEDIGLGEMGGCCGVSFHVLWRVGGDLVGGTVQDMACGDG